MASNDNCFRILTCSGISSVKRLTVLAEALLLVKTDRLIEWTIIGDGPEKGKLISIISNYDNELVKTIFLGSLSNSEVHKYYVDNPIDLFVNVSSSEGLPVSIMEAMSYGVPVLATDVGGNSEIVNNKTGMLIAADITPLDVASAISELFSEDLSAKRTAAYMEWYNNYQIGKNITALINELNSLQRMVVSEK